MPLLDLETFQKSIPSSGRLLGIDWGQKHLGLALSDGLGLCAHPFKILKRTSFQQDLAHLRDLVRTHHIIGIVVGIPHGEDGEKKPAVVQSIQSWTHRLCSCMPLPITFYDETFTSQEAQEWIYQETAKRRKRTGGHDHYAAALILQRFLNRVEGKPKTK